MTPLDQQISESRDLFKHLLHRYAWLANTFALLAPMVNDKRLKDRFSKSKELSEAASPVARALFNSCVVDVCTLVLDDEQEKINPSLRRLVRPFLPQHGTRDPKLLKRLATLCPKNETRRLSRAHAKEWAQYLTEDWGRLKKIMPQFEKMRHKWISHYEVERDPMTQQFRDIEWSTLNELYPDLDKVFQIITRLVMYLMRLLFYGEMKVKKFEREINRQADIFWGLRSAKRKISRSV
jgi:hypothetical protein